MHVGARADQEEDDEEEGLEVEEGGLYRGAAVISIGVIDLNGAGEPGRTMVARCVSLAEFRRCWMVSLIAGARDDVCLQRAVSRRSLLFWTQCWMPEQLGGQVCRKACPAALDCMWLRLPLPTHIRIPASSCMRVPEYVGGLGARPHL